MKIALVHDYLSQDGGAERVLKAFHDIWPEAPIFVLFHERGKVQGFEQAKIKQSFIGKIPLAKKRYQWFLPWMPLATERHNLHDFDVVLSSTSAFAKGVLTRPDTMHICYCHTPTRYLWTETHEYIAELKYNRAVKALLPRLIHRLRMWDKMSTDRVDHFLTNSNTVRQRIEKYYRRKSDILFPGVELDQFHIGNPMGDYFLAGGRIAAYKRFDLLIQAFNRLQYPLKIFGTGPRWWNNIQKTAKPNIEFLGRISEQEKITLMSRAKAFVHPQVEDLGITPIEAMASGCPVIAYGVGGVTETVIPGKTGVFFYEQTWEALVDTLLGFDARAWDREAIREHAMKFSAAEFKLRVKRYVEDRYEEFQRGLNQCQIDVR